MTDARGRRDNAKMKYFPAEIFIGGTSVRRKSITKDLTGQEKYETLRSQLCRSQHLKSLKKQGSARRLWSVGWHRVKLSDPNHSASGRNSSASGLMRMFGIFGSISRKTIAKD